MLLKTPYAAFACAALHLVALEMVESRYFESQATQSFVTGAACRARTILALFDVVFLLHAKETLLFFNALAIDTAAADCAIEAAETPAGTSNATARGQAVDAWVLRA